MKKFYWNLKTSDKITFLFSLFNFVWLLVLLFTINIIYFFIWYSDQKEESWYDMNVNYNRTLIQNKKIDFNKKNTKYISFERKQIREARNIEAFKKYILQKNTLILPNDWGELICSEWVAKNVHENVDIIKDKLFYNNWEKIFFIYTKIYPEIGEVKVLFDTTPYVKSQIIIIKISLFIILFSIFIFYFLWKRITKYSFKNLTKISKKAEELDIEKDFKKLKIIWNPDDEINILANTINNSFSHIKEQTDNLKQFITDVSHEFKTPLMVINSQIDLHNKKIEKNKLNEKDSEILLENIKEKTKKLDNLLETFLLLSRVENKIEKLEKKEINFSKYLQNYTENFILNNEALKNIWKDNFEINYKINKNVLLKIEQNTFNILFWNLISNAIKFSQNNLKEKKKIKLEIGLNKKEFYISDNWIWIKKEDLQNIFNKFSRTDKNIEWFWVWLFLVKRLSDLYNWKIKVESEFWKWAKFLVKIK